MKRDNDSIESPDICFSLSKALRILEARTDCKAHLPVDVFIDFDNGVISGNCDNCTIWDVVEAFERITEKLRTMSETPAFVDYDDGEFGWEFEDVTG